MLMSSISGRQWLGLIDNISVKYWTENIYKYVIVFWEVEKCY